MLTQFIHKNKGFTILEVAVTMVILTVVGVVLVESMIQTERIQILAETTAAVNQECYRQSQIIKGMPYSQLTARIPALNTLYQTSAVGDGVLSGILQTPPGGIIASVFNRSYTNGAGATGDIVYHVEVTVTINRLGTTITATNIVSRAFEKGMVNSLN